jgi:hypothetical protein
MKTCESNTCLLFAYHPIIATILQQLLSPIDLKEVP